VISTAARFRRSRHRSDDRLHGSITASAAMWPDAAAFVPVPADNDTATDGGQIRALLVNAHPDDESESAAVVYRITHECDGIVDQVVVTNGEGGHQYAALAEAYYRLPLTTAADRRELLGKIRRQELMRASRILGIRHNYFLHQKDTGVTLSVDDAFGVWDVARIKQEVRNLLQVEKYNLVVLLLPTLDTHGHHQTVAALTLEAVAELEGEDRPAVLGVRSVTSDGADRGGFFELKGYPLTRTTSREPVWSFDRRTPLGCHRSLEYSIVVNWVVAEHKSQGFFQLEGGRRTHEQFWLFETSGEAGIARWRDIVQTMERNSCAQDCVRNVA